MTVSPSPNLVLAVSPVKRLFTPISVGLVNRLMLSVTSVWTYNAGLETERCVSLLSIVNLFENV